MAVEIEKGIIERAKVKVNFLYFLTFVKILEPPTTGSSGSAIMPFVLWPHLKDLIRLLFTERLIVVLKARQIGISWLLAAYALWTALTKQGAVVLLLSKGEKEAADLLDKCRIIHSQLPLFLKIAPQPDSSEEMGFPAMMSTIRALPATKGAGRSIAATLVICDEHDFHPFATDNYAALKPSIDAGGQFVSVSTIDKETRGTQFKMLYTQARDGLNNFKHIFFGWACRPGRDEKWYLDKKKEYLASPKPYLMEQEYPTSEEEALSPTQALAAFDLPRLQQMRPLCVDPIERQGLISVFRKPLVGGRYTSGTDTSHGVGGDFSVTVVWDVQTGVVVADIMSNSISAEELAYLSVKLLEMYHNPLWGIEDNDWGHTVISKALELGYRNLFYRDWWKLGKRDDEHRTKPGWHTAEGSREVMWNDLIERVNKGYLLVPNKAGLTQFFTVIRNPERRGIPEAIAGEHDDYPVACGVAVQMARFSRWLSMGEMGIEMVRSGAACG